MEKVWKLVAKPWWFAPSPWSLRQHTTTPQIICMSGSVEEVMSRVGELQEQMQAQLTPLRINNVLGEEIH